MSDVPDELVSGRVEHVMQRHGELYNAEAGAQMTACQRNDVDSIAAQLFGQLLQRFTRKRAQIGRIMNRVQQRRFR